MYSETCTNKVLFNLKKKSLALTINISTGHIVEFYFTWLYKQDIVNNPLQLYTG